MRILLYAFVVWATSCIDARADDWERFLTGKPFEASAPDGSSFKMTLSPDGSYLREPIGGGRTSRGTWRRSARELCTKFPTSAENCFSIAKTRDGWITRDRDDFVSTWKELSSAASFGTAASADDEPFTSEVLREAFELSKTCSKECSNSAVGMVRLPLTQGKVGFLITTGDLSFCGSGGCADLVVVPSGNKFQIIREGRGTSPNQAVLLLTGAGDLASVVAGKPSFDCAKATSASARLICGDPELSKADSLLGAKFKAAADTNQAARSQLVEQQLIWIRSRNDRCGVGPDKAKATLGELQASKPCMLGAINARVAELGEKQVQQFSTPESGSTSNTVAESKPRVIPSVPPGTGCDDTWFKSNGSLAEWTNSEKIAFATSCKLGDGVTTRFWCVNGKVVDSKLDPPPPPRFISGVCLEGAAANARPLQPSKVGSSGATAAAPSPQVRSGQVIFTPIRYGSSYDNFYSFVLSRNKMHGGMGCYNTASGRPAIEIQIDSRQDMMARDVALDEAALHAALQEIKQAAFKHCEEVIRARQFIPANVGGGPVTQVPSAFVVTVAVQGYSASLEDKWIITGNEFKEADTRRRAQEDAQRRQQEMQAKVAAEKAATRSKFSSDFKVQAWVDEQRLMTNPFIYKSQVVAVQTVFSRMISESEALFVDDQTILVSNVPSTLFGGRARVYLAIRVLGTKAVKSATGEVTVPYGEYVGVYACQKQGCSEFVGQ